MRPEPIRRVILSLVLLLAPFGPLDAASPAGQATYVEGLNAYIASDYAAVAAKMKAAIADDSREALEKFKSPKGLNLVDYTPHLYLGLALEKLNQPEEALKALQESRRQAAVLGRPTLKSLLDRAQARLEARVAPPPPLAPTVVAVARKEETLPAIATPGTRPLAPTAAALPAPTRAAVLVPTLPPLLPAQATAPARTAVAAGPDPTRDILRTGIRFYLAGRYRDALSVLEPLQKKNAAARLFLAYSLASLYFSSAQPDAAMKDRALTEFAEARAAGAEPLPGTLLAPKVRDLLGIR